MQGIKMLKHRGIGVYLWLFGLSYNVSNIIKIIIKIFKKTITKSCNHTKVKLSLNYMCVYNFVHIKLRFDFMLKLWDILCSCNFSPVSDIRGCS